MAQATDIIPPLAEALKAGNVDEAVRLVTSAGPPNRPAPPRRSFLAALVGAVTVPAVVALPAPAKATPIAQEVPELLAIGERISALHETYRTAVAKKAGAFALFDRLKPDVPPSIVCRGIVRDVAVELLGPAGRPVMADQGHGRPEPIWIYKSNLIRAEIIRREVSRHTKEGRRLRGIVRTAKKFEDATAAALRASDANEAAMAVVDAEILIQDLVYDEMLAIPPSTMQGVAIYASTLLVLTEGEIAGGGNDDGAACVGVEIAKALIRISATEAVVA